MLSKHIIPLLGLCALFPMSVSAQFVADDFNDGVLGTQWTFHDSTPAGSTITEVDGHAVIEAAEGSDHWFIFDSHAYIEQDAPAGTNWEVITKIDDFDPTVVGQQRKFIRLGMQLWQDDNHFITMSTLSSEFGDFINSQNLWQFDPQDPEEGGGGSGFLRGATDLNGYPPQPFTSIFMKIQSTPRGYRGFMSTDGTNWLECLNVLKNPETADGMLVNPKIRLFEAGGFFHDGGTQAVTPAKFDYIEVNTIPDPTMPYVDDDFDGESLAELKANWDIHLGIAPGTVGLHNGELIMTAGPFSNLWSDIQQPLFIFQDAPTSASYALTTKASPLDMLEPFEIWNSYGIWLWKDPMNWILISNSRTDEDQGGVFVDVNRIETAAKFDNKFYAGELKFGQNPAPAYLRVVREGPDTRVEHSFDGTTWIPYEFPLAGGLTADIPIGTDNMQVRLFTKRVYGENDHDENNPPLDAHFEWITSEELNANVSGWELY